MNILAEFKSLKDKVSVFLSDQSKATTASIADLSSRLSLLESGAVAKIESLEGTISALNVKLTSAETNLSAATGQLTETRNSLTAAATALKLDLKADTSPQEAITAIQGAVTTTLAKLNVPANQIPLPPAKTQPGADSKTKTLADFQALSPKAKMEFMKSGGQIVD